MIACCVPGCDRAAAFTTKRLCRRHYDRARYRVEQGHSWATVLNPAGLQLLVVRVHRYPAERKAAPPRPRPPKPPPPPPPPKVSTTWTPGDQPQDQSCVTCENLRLVERGLLACAKAAWPDRMRTIALRTVEQCGLPPAIHEYARVCPYYAQFRRAGTKRIE